MARDIGDVYGEPTVRVYPNAIVRSFHPILTPEERERRMMDIARAAASLIASVENQDQEKEGVLYEKVHIQKVRRTGIEAKSC